MDEVNVNYTKEAFLHPWNLAFLITAMLVSLGAMFAGPDLAWMSNIILLFTAASELLFLGTVPRNERFQRAVKARQIAERNKPPTQKELWRELSREDQKRYVNLRRLKKDIESNYRKLSYASQGLLESHLTKIQGLLESYLNLAHQKRRYTTYVLGADEERLVAQIADLREDMEDDSSRVRAVKQRRLHILEQRLERFKKRHENLEIIEAQLATIEDVMKYINEQSLTLRNPEEITYQLDLLLSEVEETEASVEEIEDVFGRGPDLLSEIDTYEAENREQAPPSSEEQRLRE